MKRPFRVGDLVSDVRDLSRCGSVERLTPQGLHVIWRDEKPGWIHQGFARHLVKCLAVRGGWFYLTEDQIAAAPKAG